MKVSASTELVWQLAAREAVAAEFKDIEPEHVFAALLKFAELPAGELENLGAGADAVKALAADVMSVRAALKARGLDSTHVRRGVRAQLGRGGSPFSGGTIHRSQTSRELFAAAAKVAADAGSHALTATHLLETILAAPSPTIAALLGGAVMPPAPRVSNTPLLDAVGRDLTRLAAEGMLAPAVGHQAECTALLQILGRATRKSVFLVAESDDAASAVIVAAAWAIARKDAPASLQGRRLIDLTALAGIMTDAGRAQEQAVKLRAEAGAAKEVILYLSGTERAHGTGELVERSGHLESTWKNGVVQWVCRIAPQSYTRLVELDKTWTRCTEVLHVRDKQTEDLPREL